MYEDYFAKFRYFEFASVEEMIEAVRMAIVCGELHYREDLDGKILVYHTPGFEEKIAFEYRNNKIFYIVYAHNTIHKSWTIHEDKVLDYFYLLF